MHSMECSSVMRSLDHDRGCSGIRQRSYIRLVKVSKLPENGGIL
jgi:hypothetical protein